MNLVHKRKKIDVLIGRCNDCVIDLRMRVLFSVNNSIRTNLVGGNAICVTRCVFETI